MKRELLVPIPYFLIANWRELLMNRLNSISSNNTTISRLATTSAWLWSKKPVCFFSCLVFCNSPQSLFQHLHTVEQMRRGLTFSGSPPCSPPCSSCHPFPFRTLPSIALHLPPIRSFSNHCHYTIVPHALFHGWWTWKDSGLTAVDAHFATPELKTIISLIDTKELFRKPREFVVVRPVGGFDTRKK